METQREMTLEEYIEQLPKFHRARKEYDELKAELEKMEMSRILMRETLKKTEEE